MKVWWFFSNKTKTKIKKSMEIKKKISEAANYSSLCNTTPFSLTCNILKMSKTSTEQ